MADIGEPESSIVRRGDSLVQRQVEPLMVAWLSTHLGVALEPRRFDFKGGSHIRVDGASVEPVVLCEAWAHQGAPKAAQKFKVMNDAMKLVAAAKLFEGQPTRLVLLFADEDAAGPFRGGTWRAAALADVGIEVIVASLGEEIRARIRLAQGQQYR